MSSSTGLSVANQPHVKVISDGQRGDITINYNITIVCHNPMELQLMNDRQRILDIFGRRQTIAGECA